jgi:metallophosphoesterase superfamily enzyme
VVEPPLVFDHHPRASSAGYVLSGHLHPGVALRGAGGQHARLPCFWFGAAVGVLPAFGEFTGLALVSPAPGDRLFAVAEEAVVPVGRGEGRE